MYVMNECIAVVNLISKFYFGLMAVTSIKLQFVLYDTVNGYHFQDSKFKVKD